MAKRTRLLFPCLLAAACTTSTQEVNRDSDDTASQGRDSGVETDDTGDTDPFVTDTGRPGADFTSGRYKVTSLALAPTTCEPCKADVDGDGERENKISELLDAADKLFPGGFAVADVNPRIAQLLAEELVIVLMSADQTNTLLDIGVAQGERDTDGDLQPLSGEMDPGTGRPKQTLAGSFTAGGGVSQEIRFTTFGEGEITVPFQFDDNEPVLNFTLKKARVFGSWFEERGMNPEKLDGYLIGAFSTSEVLEGSIYPLIDAYDLWTEQQKQTYKDLALGLINNGADIDKDSSDPKVSGVFAFTAVAEPW